MRCYSTAALLLLALQLAWLANVGWATGDKCTNVCTCKWKNGKRTVECRDRGLKGVPDGIDPETQVLDASKNDIGMLLNNIFVKVRLTNLQKLYLRSCSIGRIDPHALYGLTNLVELDLSDNLLTAVPSPSFGDTPFLRELALAHNRLGKIPVHAFKETPNLVKLDLSSTELVELAPKGFQGLEFLESLKISNNKIRTLQTGTFEPLTKLTSIELHDNPWICDCHLREMKAWLIKQNLPTLIAPICHEPEQLVNKSFTELGLDDFACRPVMVVSRFTEATIGENASIVCDVTAIPPAKIKWIWNNKAYTNHSAVNSYQRILISEEGNFRKRSTLVLTNAQETDSSSFFCVAENQAGSVEANFTLHVSLRTAGMSTLGSGQIAGISAALAVLILLILLIIMVLFVRMKRIPQKDVKAPAPGSENLPTEGCNGGNQDPHNPQSATSTASRRKVEEIETTSFNDAKSGLANSLMNHSYVQRPNANLLTENHDYLINRGYEDTAMRIQQQHHQQHQQHHQHQQHQQQQHQQQPVIAGPCFSSAVSLSMSIDNPDLIRDTRRGSNDEAAMPSSYTAGTEYSSVVEMDGSKLLREYSECISWESPSREPLSRPSVSMNPYAPKEVLVHGPSGVVVVPGQPAAQDNFPPGAKQIRVWQKGVPVLPPVSSALKRVLGSTRSSPDEGYQEGTGTDV